MRKMPTLKTKADGLARITREERATLKRKEFDLQLAKLQAELVKTQLWVQHKGLKIVVLFEGRDAAGKGGGIKRITERVSPRDFRVVALPASTERERTQMYVQAVHSSYRSRRRSHSV